MPANDTLRFWIVCSVRSFVMILVLVSLCGVLGCGGGEQPTAATGPPKGDPNRRTPK